jgi:hypothetical protein
MEAGIEDLFDWSEHSRVQLCEASLRLLAALGGEARFPEDPAGVEALIGRVAEGRPGEAMDRAISTNASCSSIRSPSPPKRCRRATPPC